MEQGRPSTPETQLLKLIETPSGEGSSPQIIKRRGRNIFSFAAFKGRLSYYKNRTKKRLNGKKPRLSLNIRGINKILILASLVLFVYLGREVVNSVINLDKTLNIKLDEEAQGAVESAEITPLLKKLSFYTEKYKERDIFRFKEVLKQPEKEIPQPILTPSKETTPRIHEMISNLRLVGISWSEDPDVMLEDTTTKTTYFLKRGQKIEGKISIEAIFINKVILSYEGEEAELK